MNRLLWQCYLIRAQSYPTRAVVFSSDSAQDIDVCLQFSVYFMMLEESCHV